MSVIAPVDFSADNFSFPAPKKEKTGKNAGRIKSLMLYNNALGYFMTPNIKLPFGVSMYDPNKDNEKAGDPSSINYSMPVTAVAKNVDDQELVNSFFQEWRNLDNRIIDYCVEHSKILFGKTRTRDQVETVYSPCVRVKEEDGESYPPMISPKISKTKDNIEKPNILVFKGKSREPLELDTFQDLMSNVPKASFGQLIFQPRIWVIAGRVGVSMNVLQAKVENSTAGRPLGYAFDLKKKRQDDEEENANEAAEDENAEEGEQAEEAEAEAVDSDA
jgi:hypothetical protein